MMAAAVVGTAFCEAWKGKEVYMVLFGLRCGVIVKFYYIEKLNGIFFFFICLY